MSRPDVPSLVAGLAICALGVVLLLDEVGDLQLTFGVAAPVVLAVTGIVLVATGVARRDQER